MEQENSFSDLALEIVSIQSNLLFLFFKSMMYRRFKGKWKDKVVEAINKKIDNNDTHIGNYGKLVDSVKGKEYFEEEKLDVTALSSLINYDFLEVCSFNDKRATKEIVGTIRSDRNDLSHFGQVAITDETIDKAINHLLAFLEFLNNNKWTYIDENITDNNDAYTDSLITKFQGELVDRSWILNSEDSYENDIRKEVIINYCCGDKIVNNIWFDCTLYANHNGQKKIYQDGKIICGTKFYLPLAVYQIFCKDAPDGYEKFIPKTIALKVSSKEPVEFNIKVTKTTLNIRLNMINVSIEHHNTVVYGYNITIKSEDNSFVKNFKNLGIKKKLLLKQGKYTICCNTSPKGYKKFLDYEFVVDAHKSIDNILISVEKEDELSNRLTKRTLEPNIIDKQKNKVSCNLFVVNKDRLFIEGLCVEIYNLEKNTLRPFKIWHTEKKPIHLELFAARYLLRINNTDITYYLNMTEKWCKMPLYWEVDLNDINRKNFAENTSEVHVDTGKNVANKVGEVQEEFDINEESIVRDKQEESAVLDESNTIASKIEVDESYIRDSDFMKRASKDDLDVVKGVNYANKVGEVHEGCELKEENLVKDMRKGSSDAEDVGALVPKVNADETFVKNSESLKEIHKPKDVYPDRFNRINNKYSKPNYGYLVNGIKNKNILFSKVNNCQPISSSAFDYTNKKHLNVYIKDVDGNCVCGCTVSVYNYDSIDKRYELSTWIHNDDCHVLDLPPGRYLIQILNIPDQYSIPVDRVVDIEDVDVNITISLMLKNKIIPPNVDNDISCINKEPEEHTYNYEYVLECIRLGDEYFYAQDNEKDDGKAFELYEKSIEYFSKFFPKISDNENYLGKLFHERSRNMYAAFKGSKGIPFTILSAKTGYSKALYDLGYLYERGQFLDKNLETSFAFYTKAMDEGNADACFAVANFYFFGYLKNKNFERAYYYCKLAADRGCSNAINELSRYKEAYLNSKQESPDLLLETLRKGTIEEILELGLKYYNGSEGYSISYEKAFRCFYSAAVRNNPYSQYMLGLCYEKGFGVDINIFKAKEWYRKAKEGGERRAVLALKQLKERRY